MCVSHSLYKPVIYNGMLNTFVVNGNCIITLHSVFVQNIWSIGHCLSVCTYVTGYWKTAIMSHLANCILLAQLIATLMHYPCTVALLG